MIKSILEYFLVRMFHLKLPLQEDRNNLKNMILMKH